MVWETITKRVKEVSAPTKLSSSQASWGQIKVKGQTWVYQKCLSILLLPTSGAIFRVLDLEDQWSLPNASHSRYYIKDILHKIEISNLQAKN